MFFTLFNHYYLTCNLLSALRPKLSALCPMLNASWNVQKHMRNIDSIIISFRNPRT
jgi:hypothetical protein